jgi:hypothetical protein
MATLAIIRKTIGYGKRSDIISYSQFEEMTGMTRPSVCDGINYALERGLVTREKSGQYWQYSIKVVAIDYQYAGTTSSHRLPEVVAIDYQLDEKVVAIDYPQKKRNLNKTKESNTTPKGVAATPQKSSTIDLSDYPAKEPEPQPEETIPDALLPDTFEATTKPSPATNRDRARAESGDSKHIPSPPQLDLGQEVKGFEAGDGGRDMTSSSKARDKPAPKAKKQPRKVPIYPDDPPVIVLYKQKTNYEPNPYQTGQLMAKALDLDRLEETIDYWLGCGYKVNNVRGVLDRYSKGVPIYEFSAGRNDRGTGMGGPGSARPVAAHPAAPDPNHWNRPPEELDRECANYRP